MRDEMREAGASPRRTTQGEVGEGYYVLRRGRCHVYVDDKHCAPPRTTCAMRYHAATPRAERAAR